MSRRFLLLAVLSAMMLVVAACEVDDTDDDVADADSDDTEQVIEPEDQADDAVEDEATEADDADEVDEPTATPEPDPTPTPEPTPEPEPTPTSEPTEAPEPDVGTRENPIPLGESAQVGDWEVRVVDVIPDATQAVLEENQFNDPPAEGHQFLITRIEATYHGTETGTFWLDVTLNAVDELGVVYEGMESRCGVIPDNIQDRGEAFPGATIEGNSCRSVQSEHVGSLVLIAEKFISLDRERVFFALFESEAG